MPAGGRPPPLGRRIVRPPRIGRSRTFLSVFERFSRRFRHPGESRGPEHRPPKVPAGRPAVFFASLRNLRVLRVKPALRDAKKKKSAKARRVSRTEARGVAALGRGAGRAGRAGRPGTAPGCRRRAGRAARRRPPRLGRRRGDRRIDRAVQLALLPQLLGLLLEQIVQGRALKSFCSASSRAVRAASARVRPVAGWKKPPRRPSLATRADPPEAAEVAADRQRPGERAARLDLGRPPAAQLEIVIEPRVGRLVGLRPFRHQQPGDAQPVLAEREGLHEAQARSARPWRRRAGDGRAGAAPWCGSAARPGPRRAARASRGWWRRARRARPRP